MKTHPLTIWLVDDRTGALQRIRGLINGHMVSQAISVVATLGIGDLLAEGPRGIPELAVATNTHPESLYRLLRAVAAAGVLIEDDGKRFTLSDLGQLLRTDVPGSLADWAIFVGRPYHREAWANLPHTIRTGENAFAALHGESIWQWRAHEPAENAIFNRAMVSLTGGIGPELAASFDFSQFGSIVDVGGGTGALLAAILARHQAVRGILFDQPHVVERAGELLEASGVSDRCEIVSGDFFDHVPAGADAYVMKSILHDWDDEQATRIVRTVRAASIEASRLLVVEPVVGPPNEGLSTKISDLNMLVGPSGRERTLEEWNALFKASGYVISEVREVALDWNLIIGVPS